MREAAVPCTVFVLYQRGVHLSPELLMQPERRRSGYLVCLDRYTQPWWYACLFEDEGMRKEVARLLHAQLERENDGVRLYGGIEFEDRGLAEHRQAWLCTRTVDRGLEILARMQRTSSAPPAT